MQCDVGVRQQSAAALRQSSGVGAASADTQQSKPHSGMHERSAETFLQAGEGMQELSADSGGKLDLLGVIDPDDHAPRHSVPDLEDTDTESVNGPGAPDVEDADQRAGFPPSPGPPHGGPEIVQGNDALHRLLSAHDTDDDATPSGGAACAERAAGGAHVGALRTLMPSHGSERAHGTAAGDQAHAEVQRTIASPDADGGYSSDTLSASAVASSEGASPGVGW